MTAVDLRFAQAPGSTNLVFGAADTGQTLPVDAIFVATLPALTFGARAVPSSSFTFAATLPALTLSARAIPNANVALAAAFPTLALTAVARYESNTARPTIGKTVAPWQPATGINASVEERREITGRDPTATRARWQATIIHRAGIEERRSGTLVRAPVWGRSGHQDATAASPGERLSRYSDAIRLRTTQTSGYDEAQRGGWIRCKVPYQVGQRDRGRQAVFAFAAAGRHRGVRQSAGIRSAHHARHGRTSFYQAAIVPPPGVHSSEPGTPPAVICYTPSGVLLFATLATTTGDLLFVCERAVAPPPPVEPVVVPVRRVYCVLNDVILRRVSDGAEVPAFSLSLALDATSWTWGFEAVLPASALTLVDPGGSGTGPVELFASINGTDFRVLAEGVSRERSFGEASIRVSGRGRNAVLAAPYAPVMTFANAEPRTAQQLLNDVLTHNGTPTGIPLGWAVDWGLSNWNVPAGVFNHQGTRIEALNAIIGAAGGYLIPHRSAQSLMVRHRYPVAPWAWDSVTPDFVLPVDAVARESLTWQEKPAYNRVFVSGQEIGVLAQVTRAGTAGDLLAPMVVDPLITEAMAARQRGLAVLADTGRQIAVNLRLPVLAETGVIEPGAFIEYQDGSVMRLGLVRSTQVQAGLPEVWQTLGVEAHV